MPNPIDPETGRPRRGRPPTPTTHTIHSDGTYSNRPTAEVVPPPKKFEPLAPMTIFKTARGSQYQVMETRPWGAWVTPCPYSTQPRIDQCDFWSWEKMEKEIG